MAKKILITGATGFVGYYLSEYLASSQQNITIVGTCLNGADKKSSSPSFALKQVDLLEKDQVASLIQEFQPDEVYHLAALSSPGHSFKNPLETIVTNTTMQVHLLEALKNADLRHTKFLLISSADVYGLVQGSDLPIDEQTPLMPTNPYGVSKITQDFLGLQYFLSYKLNIFRARPFNHIGPRQSDQFVVASFAKKIAEIEKGKQEPMMMVGNLEAKRDFTDVRDIVRAYSLILQKGKPGDVYNIGSGKSYTIKEILEKLLSFSTVKITIQVDQSLFRPTENPDLRCDTTKFTALTQWQPEISLDETLKQTLDYWRRIV